MPARAAVYPTLTAARAAGRSRQGGRGSARRLTAADAAPHRLMQAPGGLGTRRLARPMHPSWSGPRIRRIGGGERDKLSRPNPTGWVKLSHCRRTPGRDAVRRPGGPRWDRRPRTRNHPRTFGIGTSIEIEHQHRNRSEIAGEVAPHPIDPESDPDVDRHAVGLTRRTRHDVGRGRRETGDRVAR